MTSVVHVWLRFGVWLAALSGCVLVCRGADENSGTRWRVAMMDFTCDDGLMRSAAGAAEWSALTQDALAAQVPDLDWVERSQLHLAGEELSLSAGGFTTPDGSLRLGKWLKADAAILGHFTRNAQDDGGHTLRLEVVDLDRADILATRTIQIDGDRRDAITPFPKLVAGTAGALREALAETKGKLVRAAHQKVIAPLFFHNADPSPRLNGFGSDLLEAFSQAAADADGVRVLRFLGADDARDEADLAVRGLAEVEANTWQHVADLYVWGSYRELPSPHTAFEQMPVEVELTWWDGVNPTGHQRETTTVERLPAVARRLAGQCLDAARQVPASRAVTGTVREEIAGTLREQGQQLEEIMRSHAHERKAFRATAEGRTLAQQERLVLAAACFFAPTDQAAELARLRTKWEDFPSPVQRLPLLDLWRRSNDLADYTGRFGSAETDLTRANVDADAFLLERLDYGEAQIHVPGSEANLPVDITDADIAAWHKTLETRFAHDASAYAKLIAQLPPSKDGSVPYSYAAWMQTSLQRMRDPALAVQIVETTWPSYRDFYRLHQAQEDNRYGYRSGGLPPAVQVLYARLHQPERATKILEALTLGDTTATSTPAVAAAKGVVAPATVSLPPLTPIFRPIRLPAGAKADQTFVSWGNHEPSYAVQNFAVGSDDVLWISLFRGEDVIGGRPDQTTQELWRFDPLDDSLTKLSLEGLTARTPITSILPQADTCWLTVGLSGVWQCDVEGGRVTRRWAPADGLLTANMDAGATTDEAIYFAGHENQRTLLNRFDPDKQRWMRVDLPDAIYAPPAVAASTTRTPPRLPPAAQIAAFGRWLLVRMGEDWTLVDTSNQQMKSLGEVLPVAAHRGDDLSMGMTAFPMSRLDRLPLPGPHVFTADARGFWAVVDGRIYQFDPAHPQDARSWSLPGELAAGVTALASDGDDLWLAGRSAIVTANGVVGNGSSLRPRSAENERGFVAVLHEVDGRWRGGFELPAPVGCLGMSRQTVYVDQQMTAQPLLEIEKSSTLGEPGH